MGSAINHQILHLTLYLILCCFFVARSLNASTSASQSSLPRCLQGQSSILLQFKQEFPLKEPDDYFTDYSYPKMETWKAGTNCCSWDGIECDKTGHVVGLDLSSSSLEGPLHSNSSLFGLTHLQHLNLAYNNFNFSTISSGFGRLLRLTHLNLSSSMFSGRIPSEISWLTNLVSLDLSCANYDVTNTLSLEKIAWRILVQNSTNLRVLDLAGVDLSSIEAEFLGNLSSLESLSLRECNLNGDFPMSIFHLPTIQSIDASFNYQLIGFLPEFHNKSSLKSLVVSSTKFSGMLFDTIGNLNSMNVLDLSNCSFSGKVPTSIGNLSQITILDLSSNNFSGEIPTSLGRLAKLEFLSLQKNQLSGQIPSSLGNLTRLTELQLSHNKLNGKFSISLANLTQLESLYLSFNQLSGSIPFDASRISNSMLLSMLDLSHNSFNGTIPPCLFKIPSLATLNLDYNQLTGPLTIQNVSSSQLANLYLRRNNLNGQIPRSISELTNLTILYLNMNNFSGEIELGIFSKLSSLNTLDLSYNSLTVVTNTSTDFTLPAGFSSLRLASCNINEFPTFLETQNELSELDLSDNKIEGKIPKWFLRMGTESLSRLYLSNNSITGWEEEPSVLPWMELDYLDLRDNKLRGSLVVPPISTRHFFIFNNSLTGKIDPVFCELPNLKVLDVSNNHLSGEIPRCLGFNSSLLMLNLQRNNFHGDIPPTCEEGSVLRTLDLSHNQLQGKIPKSLIRCKELEVLNIGHNQISDQFPFWTQSLPKLHILVLRSNKFDGPIWRPHKFWGFENLRIIDLSFNNFSGDLPSEYFRNWSAINTEIPSVNKSTLRYMGDTANYYQDSMTVGYKGLNMVLVKIITTFMSIDLSHNSFQGAIPSSIGDLKSLVGLNLTSNNFDGRIPKSLGKLSELESLDLSKNKLSGEIPQELVSLTFLQFLNLSDNQLVGPIPQGKQFDTFPNSSFGGNLDLCGWPLTKKCAESDNGPPNSDHGQGSESESGFNWKAALMGSGFGLVVGLIIENVLASRRPSWFWGIYRRIFHWVNN